MGSLKMFKNMVAVVTGAVGGFGRQTLTHLCQQNAKVFGCDIKDDGGELETLFRGKVGFLKADVRSETDMEELFKRTKEKFGRVDVLVNCAGFGATYLTMTTAGVVFNLEQFTRLLQINVIAQFNVSRLAARVMAQNKPTADGSRGVIILTSGFAAKTARRGQVGLAACYGGVESMTMPMAQDLGPIGIRVATISPGVFRTPLTSSLSEEVVEYLERCQAFPHHLGDPKEYSELVEHIINNKMINGCVLSIDGGLVLPTI